MTRTTADRESISEGTMRTLTLRIKTHERPFLAILLAASLLFCAQALRGPVRSALVMRETAHALEPADSAGQEMANSGHRLDWATAGGRLVGFFEGAEAAMGVVASIYLIVRFRRARPSDVGRSSGET